MLGVLKVAGAVRRAKLDVDVLDLSGPGDLGMRVFQHLYKHGISSVYGITATMPQMPAAFDILKELRVHASTSRVILGGAHPTMVNAAAKQGVLRSQEMLDELLEVFDAVVAGDGERAILTALGQDGLIDADDPKSPLFLSVADVATAPWPLRELIDLNSYHCWVDGEPATSVIAQLGCPFQCGFCGGRNSPTFRRLRLRPAEDVVAELEHVVDCHHISAFMFLDDELNVSKDFPNLLRRIAAAQVRRGEEWRLCGLLKSELFTQEQADLMYAAGFRKVLIGFESGHERILTNMRKMATVEHNTRAVEIAHQAGLRIKALMSLGHPGESVETIETTKNWLLETKPDEFDATVLTIYPGTPYHDEAVEVGRTGVWQYSQPKTGDRLYFNEIDQFTDTPYYKGVPGEYKSFVWTDHLRAKELVQLRDKLESSVRDKLNISWPKDVAAQLFEHSMGMR